MWCKFGHVTPRSPAQTKPSYSTVWNRTISVYLSMHYIRFSAARTGSMPADPYPTYSNRGVSVYLSKCNDRIGAFKCACLSEVRTCSMPADPYPICKMFEPWRFSGSINALYSNRGVSVYLSMHDIRIVAF